ncbi:hypothetical protein ACFXHA_10435 [Nocardia sp. NPDC059240]
MFTDEQFQQALGQFQWLMRGAGFANRLVTALHRSGFGDRQ